MSGGVPGRSVDPMFTKIVVGVDGAEGGRDALSLARVLAQADAEIVLVSAFPYESNPSRGSVEGYEQILREATMERLREAAGDDPRCRLRAVPDLSPGHAIHHVAEQERAELIVVGSCHRGAIGRVLVGDVSRATLHGATCPVAVAPKGFREHPAPVRTIGVAYNGTPQADAAVAFAATVAAATGASLRLVTVVPTPIAAAPGIGFAYDWSEVTKAGVEAAEQRLAEVVATLDVPVTTHVAEGVTGADLEQLSKDVDLMVAGSRGWGTARAVVLGSTTDRLVHHAATPIVVVPGPAAGDGQVAADQTAHA